MISTRVAAAIGAGILAVGILVGSAGAVLLGGPGSTAAGWGHGSGGMGQGMMGGGMMGGGMMGGGWDAGDMLNQMREHMGYGSDSQ